MVRRITLTVGMALAAMLGACQAKDEDQIAAEGVQTKDAVLTTAIGKAEDLSITSKLLAKAALGPALDGKGSYTVFAPVDSAWSRLEAAELQALETAEGRPQLLAVLRQHIAPGYVLAGDLDQALARKNGVVTMATMGAKPITLRRVGQSITLGEGTDAPQIVGAPILAGNDVLYRIDSLVPPPDK